MNPIKTLIEILDGSPVENVIAGLRFKPEKIIFLGFKNLMNEKTKKAISDLFNKKNINSHLVFEIVPRNDFEAITQRLCEITENNEDCWFDLSGGKDITLAAMGFVSRKNNIPMFQINVNTGNVIKLSGCDNLGENEKSYLTISEAVELNGCKVMHNPPEDFIWDLTDDFKRDIEKMWQICKKDSQKWNWQSVSLKNSELYFHLDDSLHTEINKAEFKKHGRANFIDAAFINMLNKEGLITNFSNNKNTISFSYKNKQVYECITKAGNILELYAYMLILEIMSENPGWYDDADIGVYIDWDGIIHPDTPGIYDIKNEVDIVVMRDLVPVFISCKNGDVQKEALYELETVANRFGGKYARKYLLASYISSNPQSRKYIIQRAKDMNINLIYDVQNLSREEFKDVLKNIK